MCGIAGLLCSGTSRKAAELENIVSDMADALLHRGPDDKGMWVDKDSGVALGHRRLSIIDLSQEGHQPMVSYCGRYVMVYNGEVYNFKILRKELESDGLKFRGHSDTEVMLAAISRFGVANAVSKFNGMFAFGLWDRKEKVLCLCRDRLGEKPLYYGFINNSFVFASELKAFKKVPGFSSEIGRQSIALYLRYNCIPAPYSIYKDIKKVLPGELLYFNALDRSVKTSLYWSASDIAKGSGGVTDRHNQEDIKEEVEELIKDAVRIRMESDVPLGVFLSGGIDSSLVTALMQAQSNTAIKTFTIGFGDHKYNEALDADRIARHLGTSHTCFYATAEEALKVIPDLPRIYDEPFSDSSQIPAILVSRMAREFVTVCLSGDGGDEVFGGYNRYIWLNKIWNRIRPVPVAIRKYSAGILSLCPPAKFENLFSRLEFMFSGKMRMRNPGIKFQKFLDVLSARNIDSAYLNLTSHWKEPKKIIMGIKDGSMGSGIVCPEISLTDYKRKMMYCDMINYLPNDILVKVDRASMSASLESRAVYLDHRIVESAWKLPVDMLIGKAGSKLILRNMLDKYIPREYWERPKMGFAIPIADWLRGSLNDWADDLLSDDYLKRKGFFDYKIVGKKWQEHKKGTRDWQFELWDILMFNSWLEFNGINR